MVARLRRLKGVEQLAGVECRGVGDLAEEQESFVGLDGDFIVVVEAVAVVDPAQLRGWFGTMNRARRARAVPDRSDRYRRRRFGVG